MNIISFFIVVILTKFTISQSTTLLEEYYKEMENCDYESDNSECSEHIIPLNGFFCSKCKYQEELFCLHLP